MTRKTFILDANVLLHDPDAIKKFKENNVIIPLLVLEELDGLKRLSDELGKNARHVIRYIDSLTSKFGGDVYHGVKIGDGITVKIYLDSKIGEKKGFALPTDKAANRLLLTAFHLKSEGHPVVVVSKDFVMRVKAQAIGIEAEDYENLKFSYSQLYKGYRQLEVDKETIDRFYKEDSLRLANHEFSPNEYCVLRGPEQASALARYNGKSKQLEPLLKLSRDIWGVSPLNVEQKFALDLLLRPEVNLVSLIGPAGTGKTLLALAAGMRKVFDEAVYTKILVSRPIVPLGKDIGYLPGSKEEKLYHWMQPIYDNLEFLCQSTTGKHSGGDVQQWVMESKKLEMEAVTYIRGRSLPKMYMIIDEAQNLTPHEVKTVVSRAGKGTKVVLTGDPTQIDHPYLDEDSNALTFVVGKMRGQGVFGHVFLDKTERSELAAIAAEVL